MRRSFSKKITSLNVLYEPHRSFPRILIGLLFGYLLFYLFFKSKTVEKASFDSLQAQYNNMVAELKVQEDRLKNLSDQNHSLSARLKETENNASNVQTALAVAFANSMEDIGKNLNRAQSSFTTAFDQLKTGRGNVMSQAMQLRALGLKSSRNIPAALLPEELEAPEINETPRQENH